MRPNILNSLIHDTNLRFHGVNSADLFNEAGKKISAELLETFGKNKSYAFICGFGGNAGDAFSTIIHLIKHDVKLITVYLIGRKTGFNNSVAEKLFDELLGLNLSTLVVKQDVYSEDIEQADIIVEALVGTGLEGEKLNKRFLNVIKRISHFNGKLVAIDVPAPSYKPDLTYSLNYPKVDEAKIIKVENYNQDIDNLCGPGEVKYLFEPNRITHKTKNGKLIAITSTSDIKKLELIAEVSENYLVDTFSYNFNNIQVSDVAVNNVVDDSTFAESFEHSDSKLICLVDEKSFLNSSFVNKLPIVYPNSNYIFSGDILPIVRDHLEKLKDSVFVFDKNNLNLIFTETRSGAMDTSIRRFAVENKINIVTLGLQNTLYRMNGEFKINNIPFGFEDDTKIIFLALIATFASKNDIWQSMNAATFLMEICTKLAGENGKSFTENIKEAIQLCREF